MEIHIKIVKMLVDASPSKTIVFKWVLKFENGREGIDSESVYHYSIKVVNLSSIQSCQAII